MSQYEIQYNDHPVHVSLKQVSDQLADLPEDVRKAASEIDTEDSIPRLERVLEYVAALLGSVDPALVSAQMLNELDSLLQQISSALTPLRESEDFGQIPPIHSNTDGLLNAATHIAPAMGVWAKTDVKKAASALGKAAATKTKELAQQAGSLQTRVDEIRTELDETSASIKTTSDERLNELQTQLDNLKTEAESERNRVQETIDNFQTQFKSEVENREQDFETTKKELADEANTVIEGLKTTATDASAKDQERADAAIAKLEKQGGEIIAVLNEKKEEAAKLVDLVATSSTAGAFGKEAGEQRENADRWRWTAIGFGCVAAVVAIGAVAASVLADTNNASLIIAKVTAVALLLGLAGYAAGQSVSTGAESSGPSVWSLSWLPSAPLLSRLARTRKALAKTSLSAYSWVTPAKGVQIAIHV